MDDLRVDTWLMHNTLLGWWWGKKLLPWDTDTMSVQLAEPDFFFLSAYHNMSTFHFWCRDARGRRRGERSRYLLQIGPDATDREQASQTASLADARWIDTTTGAYLNVYAVRYDLDDSEARGQRHGLLRTQDGSEVMDTTLFPLLGTTFEGVPVKIPRGYRDLLEEEYGPEALRRTEQKGYLYDKVTGRWVLGQDESGSDHEGDL
ncbi:hypothetical protein VTJ49DRAFT_6794 [Mycothermus thermophilus]|uniref:LicD/FKTN/FKRP nucleotidyltransferase domain-containing protein n=1 Tax=Humicola insolens TaxID=85995 RepID=A0ABR3VIG5_HUMIN